MDYGTPSVASCEFPMAVACGVGVGEDGCSLSLVYATHPKLSSCPLGWGESVQTQQMSLWAMASPTSIPARADVQDSCWVRLSGGHFILPLSVSFSLDLR